MAKPTVKLVWSGPPIVILGWHRDELHYLGACQEKDKERRLNHFVIDPPNGIIKEIRAFHMNDIKKDLRQWLEEKGQSKDQISDHLMRLGQTMAMV